MEYLFNNWEQFILDLNLVLFYIIPIFIFQVGIMFLRQWVIEKRKNLHNVILLGYALYFLFYSPSLLIIFHFTYYITLVSVEVYQTWFLISILFKGFTAIFFSYHLGKRVQSEYRTKLSITACLVILFILSPFFVFIPILNQGINLFNIFYALIPILATGYFFLHTKENLRKKMSIGLFGIGLFIVSVIFCNDNPYNVITIFLQVPVFGEIIFESLLLVSCVLMLYAFNGHTFFVTTSWMTNLISIYIIDKKSGQHLFSKDFLEKEVKSDELFSGGITGIVQMIKNFFEDDKDINTIQVKNNLFVLEHGKHVISAMIIKRELLDIRLALKDITQTFEHYFKDVLEQEKHENDTKIRLKKFQPTEIIVKNILKFEE